MAEVAPQDASPSPATHTDELPLFPQSCPQERCNLVMKGGVTSGVIFPGSIIEFATVYRFEQLGGTSAGAIAAAFAAAAEYRRRKARQQNNQADLHTGFVKLWLLSLALTEKPPGSRAATRLEALFAPNHSTRSLFGLVSAASHKQWVPLRVTLALLRWYSLPSSLTLVGLGLVLFALGHLLMRDPTQAVVRAYVGGSMLLSLGALSLFISVLVLGRQSLEANDMGLSRAFEKRARASEPQRFTEWMHQGLADISGEALLTFGQLSPATYSAVTSNRQQRAADRQAQQVQPIPDEREMDAFRREADTEDITLRQITTCLSYGRPYVLPLDPESTDAGHFYFRPSEWEEFFPEDVLEHLKRHSRQQVRCEPPDPDDDASEWEYYQLPPGQDFPVLVATRLSMSFPGLFSAVPLYGPGWSESSSTGAEQAWVRDWSPEQGRYLYRQGYAAMQRLYFGDGGLTSNFPISLFDELVPRHPTFALNLEYPAPHSGVHYDGGARLIPPDRLRVYGKADQISETGWTPAVPRITSLFGYAMSIMEASRNWTDNAMIPLPGYSERIAHIQVGNGQGGLNLTMTAQQISELRGRGRQAARLLIARFHKDFCGPHPAWNWEIHQAMNFITLSADLEMLAQQYVLAYADPLGKLNVPALYNVQLQDGNLFPGAHLFNDKHVQELLAFGNQSTTLRGFRKLRGKRGVLRYRPLS